MKSFESPLPVLTSLFAKGKTEVYSRSEVIPTGDTVNQIVSGYVALYENNTSEDKRFLLLFGKNEIFPYPYQLFDRRSGREYVYRALDSTQIRSIPQSELQEAMGANLEVCHAMVRYMGTVLNMAFERIGDLEGLTVMDRLKKRLLFFADRFGIQGDDRIIIDIPFTNTDIALSIGTTRETVNRMLNQLQKENKISVVDRKITIHRTQFES